MLRRRYDSPFLSPVLVSSPIPFFPERHLTNGTEPSPPTQPYHTQARDALAKHELAKQEWWRTADPALIRAINEKRVARKKPKIAAQRAREDRGPANAYALYVPLPRCVEPKLSLNLDLRAPRSCRLLSPSPQIYHGPGANPHGGEHHHPRRHARRLPRDCEEVEGST